MTTGNARPLHVLEVETFGRGGLVHYAYNLSRALVDRGHRVTLLTTCDYELEGLASTPQARDPQARDPEARDPEGRFEVVKAFARWTGAATRVPRFLLPVARKVQALFDGVVLLRTVWRCRADVVHVHCTNPVLLVYLLLLRLLGGRPVVATAHVVTPHEPIPLQRILYRWVHRLPRLVVAHSQVDARRLHDDFGVPSERLTVIPHGEYGFFEQGGQPVHREAARRDLGIEDDDEVALFFGYVREYKGLDLLLDAWPGVRERRPRARLVIAGDPVRLDDARRRQLEEQARSVGAQCHFGYLPFSEVPRFFGAADVLVMPYRSISQSGVLFLALSLRLPVVATRVGALPEMLVEGESAAFVPPEDVPALEETLATVLGDAELRARLAAGGAAVAEAHSWSTIAQDVELAFVELAHGSPVQPRGGGDA